MARLPKTEGVDPTATMTTLSVRMPTAHKDELAEMAKEKRMETGALVQTADLIREAISEYLKAHRKA
ncbi:hypothetical protein THIOKS11020008 [Thiocapsa sp. KS1]|nr:hypothetical protein THIOKS11020008 [Thiocapsa sp. KS1]